MRLRGGRCLLPAPRVPWTGLPRPSAAHRATVQENVLYDVRGANIYIEDGNEMDNAVRGAARGGAAHTRGADALCMPPLLCLLIR